MRKPSDKNKPEYPAPAVLRTGWWAASFREQVLRAALWDGNEKPKQELGRAGPLEKWGGPELPCRPRRNTSSTAGGQDPRRICCRESDRRVTKQVQIFLDLGRGCVPVNPRPAGGI